MQLLDNNLPSEYNQNIEPIAFIKLALLGAFLYSIYLFLINLVADTMLSLTLILNIIVIIFLTAFFFFMFLPRYFKSTLKSKLLPSILIGGIWTGIPALILSYLVTVIGSFPYYTFIIITLCFSLMGLTMGGLMALFLQKKKKN